MKILQRYIAQEYLLTVVLTVTVFTFVMSIGALVRIIDLIARGASGAALMEIFFLNIPFLLQFTIPLSALTATLLVIGRLSAEGEVTAMRCGGLSLAQIAAPIYGSAIGLAVFAFVTAQWLSPLSRHRQHAAMARLTDTDPVALLEEGRFTRDFPGLLIYVGRKGGAGRIQDVVIRDVSQPRVRTHIRARAGEVRYDETSRRLMIRLEDVHITKEHLSARGHVVKTETAYAQEYPQDIDLQQVLRSGPARKKITSYTIGELIAAATQPWTDLPTRAAARERMRYLVELNNRTALAFGCFAFTLVGVPLGIRSRRRESSFGVAVGIGIVFLYYLFMILARELTAHPEWRPDLLPWIPVVIAELVGLWYVHANG